MIIKSNLPKRIYFDFIGKMGRWINPGLNTGIDDYYIQNRILADMVTNGTLEVISYDTDIYSTVQQGELIESSGDRITKINFTNLSPSTLLLYSIPAGKTLEYVNISVSEPFAVTKYIEIGFPSNHSEIFQSYETNLSIIDDFYTDPFRKSSSGENLYAYFSGASTTGSGIIYISVI